MDFEIHITTSDGLDRITLEMVGFPQTKKRYNLQNFALF